MAGAPEHDGREPQTPESDLLCIADKLSGSDDLMQRLLTPRPG
jgi:3'-5' exoribonuclease